MTAGSQFTLLSMRSTEAKPIDPCLHPSTRLQVRLNQDPEPGCIAAGLRRAPASARRSVGARRHATHWRPITTRNDDDQPFQSMMISSGARFEHPAGRELRKGSYQPKQPSRTHRWFALTRGPASRGIQPHPPGPTSPWSVTSTVSISKLTAPTIGALRPRPADPSHIRRPRQESPAPSSPSLGSHHEQGRKC